MGNSSDKDLLKIMGDFPKHELSTKQRTRMLKVLAEAGSQRPKRSFQFQKIGVIAALFLLALIAPIVYLTNSTDEKGMKSGAVTQEAKPGDYFALTDEEGKAVYADRNFGIPNKVSLLAPQEWVARDSRSVGKVMIFLWGDNDKLFANKTLTVDAVHQETGAKIQLAATPLSGRINGADAHAVTSFKPISFAGKWNLEFSIDDKPFDKFSIYVKEPYVNTGNWTLLISQEDLVAGFYEDVFIEVEGKQLPEEIVLELFSTENAEVTTFTFKDKTDYTTTDGKNISMYKGDFQIKKSGKYRFTVLQQSQAVDVRKPLSE